MNTASMTAARVPPMLETTIEEISVKGVPVQSCPRREAEQQSNYGKPTQRKIMTFDL